MRATTITRERTSELDDRVVLRASCRRGLRFIGRRGTGRRQLGGVPLIEDGVFVVVEQLDRGVFIGALDTRADRRR